MGFCSFPSAGCALALAAPDKVKAPSLASSRCNSFDRPRAFSRCRHLPFFSLNSQAPDSFGNGSSAKFANAPCLGCPRQLCQYGSARSADSRKRVPRATHDEPEQSSAKEVLGVQLAAFPALVLSPWVPVCGPQYLSCNPTGSPEQRAFEPARRPCWSQATPEK